MNWREFLFWGGCALFSVTVLGCVLLGLLVLTGFVQVCPEPKVHVGDAEPLSIEWLDRSASNGVIKRIVAPNGTVQFMPRSWPDVSVEDVR